MSDPTQHLPAVLGVIGEVLGGAGARDVRLDATGLTFRGGLFASPWSLNLLVPITKGHVGVGADGRSIEYRLWVTEILLLSTAMALLLGGVIAAVDNWQKALLLAGIAWLCLTGFNFILTRLRFSRLVHRAVGNS